MIPKIPIGKNGSMLGEFDLFWSYYKSARCLYASAYDANARGETNDSLQDYLIVSVYLFRHSFELGLKNLAGHPLLGIKIKGHELNKIWKKLKPNLEKTFRDNSRYIWSSQRHSDQVQEDVKNLSKAKNFERNPETVLNKYLDYFDDGIDKALKVFKTMHLLEDEELFRYAEHHNANKLAELATIPQGEMEIIGTAILWIHKLYLGVCDIAYEIKHAKKTNKEQKS